MMKKLGWGLAGMAGAGLGYALVPRRSRLAAGQVAVITGGSRGLGLAMAREFGRAGLRLVLAARGEEELSRARQSMLEDGDVADARDILLVPADLTDPEQASGLIDKALQAFGRVDVLINNAAVIEVGPFSDQPIDAYYRAMQLTYFAALHTIHAAVPHMVSRGSGAIVNISSVGGKVPVPHLLPYVGAKFALTGFSEGLHAELRGKGIRVTTVCPGLMRSGGEEHAHYVGNTVKEEAWFKFSAQTPGIAVSVEYAAGKIFQAVSAGRAEITISPQAWLAARVHGLMPETTQAIAAVVNEYVLPKGGKAAPLPAGAKVREVYASEQSFADPSPS